MAARIKNARVLAGLGRRRPAPAPSEAETVGAVLAYLAHAQIPAWRTNSGTLYVAGRLVRLAPAGTADVLGCLPGGRLLAVEVKRKGGRLRPAQALWLDRMRAQGALAFVARAVADVYAALAAEGYDAPRPN